MTQAHAHRLRLGRYSEPGRVYIVTTVTNERRPVFENFRVARIAIGALRECSTLGEAQTLAFVLMPDHLHWMFELGHSHLDAVVRRFKSVSSRRINEFCGTPGLRVWQAGFYDRALRQEQDLQAVARYIVGNPLRAGSTARLGDYPHWDAIWLQ